MDPSASEEEKKLERDKQAFEQALLNLNQPAQERFLLWRRYIKWTKTVHIKHLRKQHKHEDDDHHHHQHHRHRHSHPSKQELKRQVLFPLLNRLCQEMKSEHHWLKDEKHFVRFHLENATFYGDEQLHYLHVMRQFGIGLSSPLFWKAFAIVAEHERKFDTAEDIYQEGITLLSDNHKNEQDCDEVKKAFQEFQKRMHRRRTRNGGIILRSGGMASDDLKYAMHGQSHSSSIRSVGGAGAGSGAATAQTNRRLKALFCFDGDSSVFSSVSSTRSSGLHLTAPGSLSKMQKSVARKDGISTVSHGGNHHHLSPLEENREDEKMIDPLHSDHHKKRDGNDDWHGVPTHELLPMGPPRIGKAGVSQVFFDPSLIESHSSVMDPNGNNQSDNNPAMSFEERRLEHRRMQQAKSGMQKMKLSDDCSMQSCDEMMDLSHTTHETTIRSTKKNKSHTLSSSVMMNSPLDRDRDDSSLSKQRSSKALRRPRVSLLGGLESISEEQHQHLDVEKHKDEEEEEEEDEVSMKVFGTPRPPPTSIPKVPSFLRSAIISDAQGLPSPDRFSAKALPTPMPCVPPSLQSGTKKKSRKMTPNTPENVFLAQNVNVDGQSSNNESSMDQSTPAVAKQLRFRDSTAVKRRSSYHRASLAQGFQLLANEEDQTGDLTSLTGFFNQPIVVDGTMDRDGQMTAVFGNNNHQHTIQDDLRDQVNHMFEVTKKVNIPKPRLSEINNDLLGSPPRSSKKRRMSLARSLSKKDRSNHHCYYSSDVKNAKKETEKSIAKLSKDEISLGSEENHSSGFSFGESKIHDTFELKGKLDMNMKKHRDDGVEGGVGGASTEAAAKMSVFGHDNTNSSNIVKFEVLPGDGASRNGFEEIEQDARGVSSSSLISADVSSDVISDEKSSSDDVSMMNQSKLDGRRMIIHPPDLERSEESLETEKKKNKNVMNTSMMKRLQTCLGIIPPSFDSSSSSNDSLIKMMKGEYSRLDCTLHELIQMDDPICLDFDNDNSVEMIELIQGTTVMMTRKKNQDQISSSVYRRAMFLGQDLSGESDEVDRLVIVEDILNNDEDHHYSGLSELLIHCKLMIANPMNINDDNDSKRFIKSGSILKCKRVFIFDNYAVTMLDGWNPLSNLQNAVMKMDEKSMEISETLSVYWLYECINAIKLIHSIGVSHGNIHPSNLLIRSEIMDEPKCDVWSSDDSMNWHTRGLSLINFANAMIDTNDDECLLLENKKAAMMGDLVNIARLTVWMIADVRIREKSVRLIDDDKIDEIRSCLTVSELCESLVDSSNSRFSVVFWSSVLSSLLIPLSSHFECESTLNTLDECLKKCTDYLMNEERLKESPSLKAILSDLDDCLLD